MEDPNLKGIIPRTFEYLFTQINQIQAENQNIQIDINLAFIQIYLENIQDLLCPKNNIQIRENSEKGIFLQNCYWANVKNEKECNEVFQLGEKNKIIESTEINKKSNTSHTILIIVIEKKYPNEENEQNTTTKGFLYLVDLAGTDRIGKSYLKGKQLEQTKKNNNSLAVLGNCIQDIISGKEYIPFRESKLTRILQDSLGGNSNISLIVTLSPSSLYEEESFSSLNFASRAMGVKINPKKNIVQTNQNIITKYNMKYLDLLNKYDELYKKYKRQKTEENEKNGEETRKYQEILHNNISLESNNSNNKYRMIDKYDKITLEENVKELLSEQGIEIGEINNNNINEIIKHLINNNKLQTDSFNALKNKLNNLNTSFEQIKTDYEEKFNKIENENTMLKNINNIYLEKIKNMEEEKNQMEIDFTKMKKIEDENNKLKIELESLNENKKQLSEEIFNLKITNQDIENKYKSEIKNYEEYKFPRLKNYVNKSENIKLSSSIKINEKLLNNSINLMINDLELFNKFKIESTGIDSIIDNDIPCLNDNNYDIIIKKATLQINKLNYILDNIYDIKNDNIKFKNNDFAENIEKLNEMIKIYKINFINAYASLNKSFNKVIELCQIIRKSKDDKLEDSLAQMKKKIKELTEEKHLKHKIFDIILKSIDDFNLMCYSSNNSDLKEELNNLQKESDKLSPLETMEKVIDIFQKLIQRCAEYRIHAKKEIKNLNGKIIYFLKEIENYKKYYNNHKTSDLDEEKRLLNNQLFLQDGEIIRLKKENDNLLKNIENLMIKNPDINPNNINDE